MSRKFSDTNWIFPMGVALFLLASGCNNRQVTPYHTGPTGPGEPFSLDGASPGDLEIERPEVPGIADQDPLELDPLVSGEPGPGPKPPGEAGGNQLAAPPRVMMPLQPTAEKFDVAVGRTFHPLPGEKPLNEAAGQVFPYGPRAGIKEPIEAMGIRPKVNPVTGYLTTGENDPGFKGNPCDTWEASENTSELTGPDSAC